MYSEDGLIFSNNVFSHYFFFYQIEYKKVLATYLNKNKDPDMWVGGGQGGCVFYRQCELRSSAMAGRRNCPAL